MLQLFSQSLDGPANLPGVDAETEVPFGNFSPHSSPGFFFDSRLLIPYSSLIYKKGVHVTVLIWNHHKWGTNEGGKEKACRISYLLIQ